MWNKVYIIIDKKNVKPQFIWKFSGGDIIIMGVGSLLGYFPTRAFLGELIALVIGIAIFVILGFLLIEMPNHLSILQHIQMWYNYNYSSPKEYFYIPKSEMIMKEKVKDQGEQDWLEYQEMIDQNRFGQSMRV